ncbi:MAG: T9SS type A sorting domain-containing protein [Bacteroidia bacterium]|nr:T9SS type A sorting domain-containing protein [Bacteroidia bacterium]
MKKILLLVISGLFFSNTLFSQLVNNGSITGAPCANSGINAGNAVGWGGCGFSPDLCCLTMPSYVASSQVTPVVSPDGGTWLGLAALAECARTTMTGLTPGTTYTLYFCGACFGTGTSIYNSAPSLPRIIALGSATFVPSIPMVASTWNRYSMTFVATAATMTLQCDHPNGSVSYASLDGFSLSSTAVCKPIILPVELVSFTADYNNGLKQVDLNWTVAMEKDLDYYSLEKSDDAVNYSEIERIYNLTGNSNSMKHYRAYDTKPYSGKVNYYRLKEVDKGGEYNYSATRSVYFSDKDAELTLVPNPANDKVELNFNSETDKSCSIIIYDKKGTKVEDKFYYALAGNNNVELDLKNYESGIYFVILTAGETSYKRKLIKQ